jgi:hypothetical protein
VPSERSKRGDLGTAILNIPINIRLNGPKRPDIANLIDKISSDSLRTASTQLSTKKKATAARNILSKSASNNRIERRNMSSKKQISRGGIARTNNRIYRSQINFLAAEKLPQEEIIISSDINFDENVIRNIFNKNKFSIIMNIEFIYSESILRSEK